MLEISDGFIHLSYLRRAGKRERAVEIVKMRGASHVHDIVPAQITPHGFVVGAIPSKKVKKENIDE